MTSSRRDFLKQIGLVTAATVANPVSTLGGGGSQAVATTAAAGAATSAEIDFMSVINWRTAILAEVNPAYTPEAVICKLKTLRKTDPATLKATMEYPNLLIPEWKTDGVRLFNLPMNQGTFNQRVASAHQKITRLMRLPAAEFEEVLKKEYGADAVENSRKNTDVDLEKASNVVVSLVCDVMAYDVVIGHRRGSDLAYLTLPKKSELIEVYDCDSPLVDDENRRILLTQLGNTCKALSPASSITVSGVNGVQITNPSEELRDVFSAIQEAQKKREASESMGR